MWGFSTPLLHIAFSLHSAMATIDFPNVGDVFPCNDLPQNCATMYYQMQKTDQSNLDTLNSQAATVATEAGDLLTAVQAVAQQAVALTDKIDPNNSQTNGGRIRVLPTGRNLVGLTPFMGTLSASIVAEANKRYSDISARMSQLTNSLAQVSSILQAAQDAVNSQISTTSKNLQSAITSTSSDVTNYIMQADSKISTLAQQFSSNIENAPVATSASLNSALAQEQTDFTNGMTKLGLLTNQANQIPKTLQSYIQSALAKLQKYESDQQSEANTQVASKSSQFASQVATATASLTAQINGLLATNSRDPYYNSSLNGYMSQQQQSLYNQISSANATQQTKLSGMMDSLTSMSSSISGSFSAILTAVNLMLAQANNTDLTFLSAAQKALTDANSTIQLAQASFKNFTIDMDTLWNSTGSILDGQTSAISAALLDKISNITQDAGAEVANLNSLMLSASSGALASDSVRQSVLDSTRQQIYSSLGSNAAALNASFATINDFLNRSSTEIKFISDIVNVISGNRTELLNATASAGINGVYKQIGLVSNMTRNITETLVRNIQADIDADVASAQVALGGANGTLALSVNQTGELINAMNSANAIAFANFTSQVSQAKKLMESSAATTSKLNDMVSSILSIGSIRQKQELAFLDQTMANATSNMTLIMSRAGSRQTALQNTIQSALSDLTSNQTALISNLTSTLTNATTAYGSQLSNISAVVNSIATSLATNNSVSQQVLTDLETGLTNAKTAVDNAYRSAVAQVQSVSSDLTSAVQSNATKIGTAAQSDVQAALDSGVSNVTRIVDSMMTGLTKNLTQVQTKISALQSAVSALQSKPQEVLDRATSLASKYNMQLSDLKSNIVQMTSENDAKSSEFESQLNSTFGDKGIEGLLDQLRAKIADTESSVNETLKSTLGDIKSMVASVDSAMTVQAQKYVAQVRDHRNELQGDIDVESNSTVKYMNQRYSGFIDGLADMKLRLDSTVNASNGIDGRLGNLSAQIRGLQTNMTDTSKIDGLITDMQSFGNNYTEYMVGFLEKSGSALLDAQAGVDGQEQTTADLALDGAQALAATSTNLARMINSTVDQILMQSAQARESTNRTSSALGAVASGANQTVSLTASQIAQIVAQFKKESEATQRALQAQQNASGEAQASVNDALVVWESLKATAGNLTQDELDSLSTQRESLLNFTDAEIASAKSAAESDINDLQSNITAIQQSVNSTLNSNQGVLDALVDQLSGLAQDANEQQTEYQNQVSSLRGYVNQVNQQLANRYQTITQLGVPFRTALETAAANDISGIVRATGR